MSRFVSGLGWLLLASMVVVGCKDEVERLTVTFEVANGLKPGDNVTMRGLAIGQVTGVDIAVKGVGVQIEVKPKYLKHLDRNGRFVIENEKLVTGKMMLAFTPGTPPGAGLKAGGTISGVASAPDPVTRVKKALDDTVQKAAGEARGLGRALANPDTMPPRAVEGTIDLDQPGTYVARLISATVHGTTADGSDWDTYGAGDPDILVQVWLGSRQILLTKTAEDTLETRWEDAVSEPFDLVDGASTMTIKVLDIDTKFNDEIGILEFKPATADARSERIFRLAGGRVSELKIKLEPAPKK